MGWLPDERMLKQRLSRTTCLVPTPRPATPRGPQAPPPWAAFRVLQTPTMPWLAAQRASPITVSVGGFLGPLGPPLWRGTVGQNEGYRCACCVPHEPPPIIYFALVGALPAVLAAQLHALHLGAASVLPTSEPFGASTRTEEAGSGSSPLVPQLGTAQTRSSSPESSDQRSPHQLAPPLLSTSELLSRLQLSGTGTGLLATSSALHTAPVSLERPLQEQHLLFPQQQHNQLQQQQQHVHLLQQQALLQQQQQLLELQSASGRRRSNAGRRNEEKVRRTVYISDISDAVTEAQLAAFFQDCGQLVDCRVCGDPNSSMRFAFIEFIAEEGAKQVCALRTRKGQAHSLRIDTTCTPLQASMFCCCAGAG